MRRLPENIRLMLMIAAATTLTLLGGWLAMSAMSDDPDWRETRQAFALSLRIALCCVAVLLLPGTALGYVLARKEFPGKSLLAGLVHVPLVIPPVATGYLLLLTFGRRSLLGGWLEHTVGLSLAFTWQGAVLSSAVVALPLMVRSVRLATEGVECKLEQAARTMGASPARVFLTVTLPLAGPGILAGCVLAMARSLGEFGATMTFVGNVAGETATLPLATWSHMQYPGGQGAALRLVSISVALALGAVMCSELLARRMARQRSGE